MNRESERKRLVELLDKNYMFAEDIADHLLDNGIVVPPVKVGDVVYFAVDDYHDSAIIDGIHITEEGILFTWAQYEVGYELTECWDEGEFNIDEIGKTVFLTREDAEKALKGEEK